VVLLIKHFVTADSLIIVAQSVKIVNVDNFNIFEIISIYIFYCHFGKKNDKLQNKIINYDISSSTNIVVLSVHVRPMFGQKLEGQ
jgi:hypothetical protein